MESMVNNLFVMERAVVQNAFHLKHCQYRKLDPLQLLAPSLRARYEDEDEVKLFILASLNFLVLSRGVGFSFSDLIS